MIPHIQRAGKWFVHSGIQQAGGGVARYYRSDLCQNHPVSTEITGYALSTLLYLHSLTGDVVYLERAQCAARLLTETAWNRALDAMPFELDAASPTYFFDCGIIVRSLLALWKETSDARSLEFAATLARQMARDFAAPTGDFHPILALPAKTAIERDALRWSRSSGCYQLKAALAWWEVAEATGDASLRAAYERVLEYSLATYADFLPGHPDRLKVMDRLHAFSYFLEGMLPVANDARCAAAIRDGIERVAFHLRAVSPSFERSDVYAQLLRMRLYADRAGVAPLDRPAAEFEAARLAEFQAASSDPRIDGGFYFGRANGVWLPYVNPVSTGFGVQALSMWESFCGNGILPARHLLI